MLIQASHPYDVFKILIRTILGTDPRPAITDVNDGIFNLSFGKETEVAVEFDGLNYDYIQKMFTEENGIFEIDEYGKVFYEVGRISLVKLLLSVININKYLNEKKITIDNNTLTEYEDEFYKIHSSIDLLWKQFVTKVGLSDLYNMNVTFGPDSVFSIMDFYEKQRDQYNFNDITNADILSVIYGSLLFLITGLITIVCTSGNINPSEIFVDKFDSTKAVAFIEEIGKSDAIESESKIRLFTLAMCFFNINRYFRIYSGISFDDPMVNVVANIGYAVSLSLKSDDDFNFIDDEMITGIFGSKASFVGFTGNYDALKNFITYKESFAIKNDISVPWAHSSAFLLNLKTPPEHNDLCEFYTPLITKYIETNVSLLSYTKEDDLSVDRSFNFLRDCVTGAELEFITKVDPFAFYQITLIASTYRTIKNKSEIFNKLSDDRKKKVTFGVWLADSLLFTLYNQWFNSGKFYDQALRPKYTENLIQSTLAVLKKEVDIVINTYLEFLKYPTSNDEELNFIHLTNLLYSRNIQYIDPKYIYKTFGYDYKEFSTRIKSETSSIIFTQIASGENINFKFDTIISNLAQVVDITTKNDLLKVIATAEVSESFFTDDLLNKLFETSITIQNNSTLNDDEFLFLTYLPIIDAIENMLSKANTGKYFDFVTPDQLKIGNNYEFILNEEIRSPIAKISTIENAF